MSNCKLSSGELCGKDMLPQESKGNSIPCNGAVSNLDSKACTFGTIANGNGDADSCASGTDHCAGTAAEGDISVTFDLVRQAGDKPAGTERLSCRCGLSESGVKVRCSDNECTGQAVVKSVGDKSGDKTDEKSGDKASFESKNVPKGSPK